MEIAKNGLRQFYYWCVLQYNHKNQDNPIKTVGRDSYFSPKPLKIQVF